LLVFEIQTIIETVNGYTRVFVSPFKDQKYQKCARYFSFANFSILNKKIKRKAEGYS